MKWMIAIFLSLPLIGISQHSVSLLNTKLKTLNNKPYSINNESQISFEVIRGMMYVTATINDQEGNFILDTGAPSLILNNSQQKEGDIQARSISGSFSIHNSTVDKFEWAGIEYKNLDALSLDISHLGKASKKKILGMIGYNALKDHELFIDFEQQELRLLTSDEFSLRHTTQAQVEVSMMLHGHLPVITIEIGGKKLRFGLDTGAAVNLIDQSLLEKLPQEIIEDLHLEEIQGVDQSICKIQAATLTQTELKGHALQEMKFLFIDFTEINRDTDLRIDGLLGYPFFKQLKCSLNYKKKKIYLWEFLKDHALSMSR